MKIQLQKILLILLLFTATTSTSATKSVIGFGMIVILFSSGSACGLTITYKLLKEILVKKNKFKKTITHQDKKLTDCLIKFTENGHKTM